MSVLRWSPPLLAAVAALGIAACTGSTGSSTEAVESDVATSLIVGTTPRPTPGTPSTLAASTSTVIDRGGDQVAGAAATTEPEKETTETTQAPSTDSVPQETSALEPSTTSSTATTQAAPASTPIRIRLDRRVDDVATEGFAAFAEGVLTDARGWSQAGFVFSFDDDEFDYTVVLAEGSDVDDLCLPYDTFGRFSCQIGPTVALNADRWRTAVDSWPASLDEYRTMLVNHEVGHLIGQHHPATRCPGAGQPAPVMAQQSSGVSPCLANPWPLAWELVCAASGLEPLAPPYERSISLTCGPDGPIG